MVNSGYSGHCASTSGTGFHGTFRPFPAGGGLTGLQSVQADGHGGGQAAVDCAGQSGNSSLEGPVSGTRGRRVARHAAGEECGMASYSLNPAAIARARRLIDSRQYVLDSDWGEVQPRADAQNAYLANHSWDEYAEWHLGLTDHAADQTKARYAFVYGDFRRIHRTGLIACVYRASEWRHKDIELAAHDLLQHLDRTTA
jgi:hypothetical protein